MFNTYQVRSRAGRLLLMHVDGAFAYRVAHRIADERGVEVEVIRPDDRRDVVFPA